MLKRVARVFIALVGFIALFLFITHYKPLDTLQRIRRKREYNQAALDGAMLGCGIPPGEYGIGIGDFTLEKLHNLKLRVPREYINYKPNEPSGKVHALLLSFFLPDMESRITMEKKLSDMDTKKLQELLHALHISVFIAAKDKYIRCYKGHCLGPEFGVFQVEMNFFQEAPSREQTNEIQRLKNGQYDTSLDLVVYKGTPKYSATAKGMEVETIYIKQNADPTNPKEWIHCKRNICEQHWFRNGLYVGVTFKRTQLPKYTVIREGVDRRIDEFIQNSINQQSLSS